MTRRACLLALAVIASAALPARADKTPFIDDRFCQALIKHAPNPDVKYQAGVDVRGKPVVPADLPSGYDIPLPQELAIPLSVDLMSFLALDPAALPASAMKRNDIPLGTLTLRGDQVFWGDKPLSDAQQENLAVLCLKPDKKR